MTTRAIASIQGFSPGPSQSPPQPAGTCVATVQYATFDTPPVLGSVFPGGVTPEHTDAEIRQIVAGAVLADMVTTYSLTILPGDTVRIVP